MSKTNPYMINKPNDGLVRKDSKLQPNLQWWNWSEKTLNYNQISNDGTGPKTLNYNQIKQFYFKVVATNMHLTKVISSESF